MQACRYLHTDFCAATGIAYGPVVERWALTALSAENEAEAYWAKKHSGR
jgi:hypothetical protein